MERNAYVLRRQGGFSLVELALVLVIIAILAAAALWVYQTRIRPASEARNLFNAFQSVLTALDQARSANGNAYPAVGSATTLLNIPQLAPFVGTESKDVVLWTYQCPQSTSNLSTMTIVMPLQGVHPDAVEQVRLQIDNLPGWTATTGTGGITAQRTGVLCR